MRGLPPTLLALALAALACTSDSPSSPDSTVPPEVGAWLRQNATEFRTSIAVGSDDDLSVLTSLVGGARVVALGEATHGTSDFFEMKHRVLRYLVEHMGFNAFAIEASFPEAEAIDEYVRTGKGDPAVLLSRLFFWTWNTQEVLDMIQWLRAYNLTALAGKQVHFFGFDMQYPGAAMDSLRAYVGRVDPGRGADSVFSALACYLPYMNDYRGRTMASYSPSPEQRARCKAGVTAAYAWVAAHQAPYEAASSPAAFRRALQYARLVVQAEDVYGGGDSWARDRYMAENAAWLLNQLPAGSKIVLWAHNGHVNRYGSAMGTHLSQTFGGDLVVFGFDFYGGRFNAVNVTAPGTYTGLITHSIAGAPYGSYEQYFHSAGRPRMIVPLRGTVPDWLAGPRRLRSIGAVYAADYDYNFYVNVSLPAVYDAVIYFDQTTPSVLLPFRYD